MRASWDEGTWNWNGLLDWRVIHHIDPFEGWWTDYNPNWERERLEYLTECAEQSKAAEERGRM